MAETDSKDPCRVYRMGHESKRSKRDSKELTLPMLHQLLKPCDRLLGSDSDTLTELELATDFSALLNEPQLTESCQTFVPALERSVTWISKRVFVVSRSGDRALQSIPDFRSKSSSSPQISLSFRCTHSGRGAETVIFWLQTMPEQGRHDDDESEAIQQVVDPFLRLLQSWHCRAVRLQVYRADRTFYTSHASFSEFVSTRSLCELEFINVNLLGSQCHALGHVRRDDLKLTLWDATMDEVAAFATGLSQYLGPTKMEVWTMMNSAGLELLGSWTENSRLTHLTCGGSANLQTENIGMIISALAVNKGLQHLCVSCSVSTDAWASLWKAIAQHPTLVEADIRNSSSDIETTCIREYTRVVANCMMTNRSLQKISIPSRHRDGDIWRRRVIPALEANRFRPRFESIWSNNDDNQRDALIVKALASVSRKPHLLFLALNIGSLAMDS